MTAEKFTFDDLRKNSYLFGEVLFIRALMLKQKELGIADITKVAPNGPDGKMEVVLTVNGVQLPFFTVLAGLKDSLGNMDREQLDQWVGARMGGLFEAMERLQAQVLDCAIRAIGDKFPESADRLNDEDR